MGSLLTSSSLRLQKFFKDAGNAEFFDENASITTALQKLGLPSLNVLFPGLSIALMPHQVIGVAWMLDKERAAAFRGGILSDEVRLIIYFGLNLSSDLELI